ncbi:hypothetical protein ABEB36_005168 [Hypothenemus hampei]|uniref:Nose resistant-to-fluoxetine protein N-terminal domain-containing protein n=1 Tax=Hypothenemus hampei TaxID=57062 RepID=A0ABD1EX95_HYPHA
MFAWLFLALILVQNVSKSQCLNDVIQNSSEPAIKSLSTGIAVMKLISERYDQHHWIDRLDLLKGGKCSNDMTVFLNHLYNSTEWAVKMYDASGRYNGQFFFGNDYWMGSWTFCNELQNKETNVETPPFPTQYYVAKININVNAKLTPMTRLVHLGLCLPKSCSVADVRKLLSEEVTQDKSATIVDVRTVPGNYSLLRDFKFQIISVSGLVTFLLIITASVLEVIIKRKIGTPLIKDVETQKSKEKILSQEEPIKKKKGFVQLLLAFSAVTNGRKILSLNNTSKDLSCLHGLRVFSICWIILVHTYLQVFGVARNKGLRQITERNFLYQTIANATFSVDTFFFISGFLLTLGFFRNNDAAKEKNISKTSSRSPIIPASISKIFLMISFRFIRLTPAYLFVLVSNEVIMRYIHNNSFFTPAIIDHITCGKFWWRNVLYINNFYPRAEFCMLWSWYIANDTQFFVIASVLLLTAIRGSKQLKYVAVAIGLLLITSWLTTFILTIKHHYVARIQDPFAMFDELYDKPWLRIGPYLIGMVTGYAMYKLNGRIILTAPVVIIGWTLSLACLASLVYGLGTRGLVIPASAFYTALGHTAWALSIAWITVACSSGYGGPLNVLFSWKFFLPLSRLTYGAYLVHPILMCLTTFNLDGSLQIHKNLTIVIFFGNVFISFLCAFIVSLGLEAPPITFMKIIFSKFR